MIYFDHAATSPILPEALEEYCRVNRECFANAGSNHAFGRKASRLLDECRQSLLGDLGLVSTHDLMFTSGATEANNEALKSIALQYQNRGKRIISCSSEHSSVYSPLIQLRDFFGFEVIFLPASKDGAVDIEELKKVVDKNTILVSIMAVNNETGALSPIAEIASFLKGFPKCFFHVDATQALGKVSFDYKDVDLISASAHKFGGPKGVGFLAYKKAIRFLPLVSGGEQENGFRAGTENVPAIAAMRVALPITLAKQKEVEAKVRPLKEAIKAYCLAHPDLMIQNSPDSATPFIYNFSFTKHKGSVVLEALSLKEIFVTAYSACNRKKDAPSRVLISMGFDEERSKNSLRLSFGEENTLEQMNTFIAELDAILQEVHIR